MQGFPESVRDKLAVFFLKQQFPMTVKQINDAGRLEKTGAYPNKSEQKQIHDRSRDADCGKFTGSREAANDERIDGIVKLLQDISEDQRKCQGTQMPVETSLSERFTGL